MPRRTPYAVSRWSTSNYQSEAVIFQIISAYAVATATPVGMKPGFGIANPLDTGTEIPSEASKIPRVHHHNQF
jgi:hypothetical protein